ncbi:prolipoprotein diacylglyceryl transferase [Chitinophaga sancti]|uniref:Phosphatidylglycerol:prolipoprotein diacylglycerol transferase n=1 Tax=Chitinophaga sancti TaxID=1004 RepID=A0A1K1SJY0_9BACT|nr:prolipoprotein diacylglyceryl transferase family protein [Chitinophaga sancti]WQD64464.1 prolipoprotein diacylglyceryl transferase family protein [Chitinophaga sancti]WQG89912.1 prolipoprotein diacylglyceryl transferase [Chitinophaga sancti]SFW84383.1 phosphatidylglycerol:prolipoprotein diacylglycerol transferase [Chitinophaga sancti]
MFPTIGDLISYIFHVHVKVNLQTFGSCMALAFAGAYVVFVAEFKRKEKDGTIGLIRVKDASKPLEVFVNAFIGFLIGYKVVAIMLALFVGHDPVSLLFSLRGNWIAGSVLALVWGLWAYYSKPVIASPYIHPYQLMPYIVFMVAVWGFLGAKLFDAAEHFQELLYDPKTVLFSRSGFTYYGGLIFGALTYLWIGYRHRIKLIHMADIGSPGMMLAYGIGRIGCQLSGDGDWGIVNKQLKPGWIPQWAWAYTYPHNAIDAGVYKLGYYELPAGVYPTPLYEAVLCILLFLIMWMIRKRLRVPGTMFFLFLVLNGVERYYIEIIRITPKYTLFQLSQAQLIALLFMAGGVGGFVWLTGRSYFSPTKQIPKL